MVKRLPVCSAAGFSVWSVSTFLGHLQPGTLPIFGGPSLENRDIGSNYSDNVRVRVRVRQLKKVRERSWLGVK